MQHDDAPSTRPQDASDDDWLKAAADWWSEALQQDGAGFRAQLDAAAKEPATDAPERVDPALFTQHVIEDLDALIRGYACFVRLGIESYSGAYNSCRLYAWRRGAWGFSPEHLADLEDWIHDRLSSWIETEVL